MAAGGNAVATSAASVAGRSAAVTAGAVSSIAITIVGADAAGPSRSPSSFNSGNPATVVAIGWLICAAGPPKHQAATPRFIISRMATHARDIILGVRKRDLYRKNETVCVKTS